MRNKYGGNMSQSAVVTGPLLPWEIFLFGKYSAFAAPQLMAGKYRHAQACI